MSLVDDQALGPHDVGGFDIENSITLLAVFERSDKVPVDFL